MSSNSSSKERTRTKVLMACTSCRSRKIWCNVDPSCRMRGYTCVYEPVNATYPEVPVGDEVFLYDPYSMNSVSTSLSPSPASGHSDSRFSQLDSRHSYSTDRESYSQSPSAGHDDFVRGAWGHSTNKPSETELDKAQILPGSGYTGYPEFPQPGGDNNTHSHFNHVASGTTYGENEYLGKPTCPSRVPVHNLGHSSVSQNYGHGTTSGNIRKALSGG
ncbi:hypothetical protein L218DRAFT_950609 [Marasmius fiardii PR-910]|nr:hypothetical protein L218DRAFT_950609 [Marasmius fiardii PR-910]